MDYRIISFFLSPGKFDGLVSKAENLSVIITEAKTKFKEEHKMIVDRILDRKDGEPYDAKTSITTAWRSREFLDIT